MGEGVGGGGALTTADSPFFSASISPPARKGNQL